MLNTHPEFDHRKLTGLIIVVTLLLLIANLLVTNTLSTSGQELRQLQSRKENLDDQNARLKLKILSLSTLEAINTKARELGMVRADTIVNLTSQPVVAMNQP